MSRAFPLAALAGALAVACAPSMLSAQTPAQAALAASPCAALTQADVMQVISHQKPGSRFIWKSVQIGAPRRASNGEIAAAGLPPNAVITPVLASYTSIVGDGGRDFTWNYYFYQDDFGGWAMQSNATTGNQESDLYYVKPN